MKDKKVKNLKVCENLLVDQSTYIKGTLTVLGNSSMPTIGTSTITAFNSVVTSSQTIGGSLTVSGNSSLYTLTASGSASVNSLSVTNNSTVGGNLTVTGNSTLNGDVSIPNDGSLTVGTTGSTITFFYTNFFAIPSGSSSITINNSNITNNSLILVSLTSELNDNIYVTNIVDGSFDVVTGSGTDVVDDTLFTYIIINTP